MFRVSSLLLLNKIDPHDLSRFRMTPSRFFPTHPGDLIYTRDRVPQPFHTLETPLAPKTWYLWTVRARFKLERGDFDGDGQADVALLIRHRATGKIGIAFLHRATRAVHIVGAGASFGSGGDDFSWLRVWRVEDGRVLVEVPRFRGEVLYVETPEAAGALIYWDGAKYQWTQRGE